MSDDQFVSVTVHIDPEAVEQTEPWRLKGSLVSAVLDTFVEARDMDSTGHVWVYPLSSAKGEVAIEMRVGAGDDDNPYGFWATVAPGLTQEQVAKERSRRMEIAIRHGIPELWDALVGQTNQELEADAAARSALRQIYGASCA